jgi:hypothetical protein
MVRQATDIDAKNNEKKKPSNTRILSSGSTSLDRYIG